jgi:hypothetical protein
MSEYSVYSLDDGDINLADVAVLEWRLLAVMRRKSLSMRKNSFFAMGSA